MEIRIDVQKAIYSYCFVSMSDVNNISLLVFRQSEYEPIDKLTLDFSNVDFVNVEYINDTLDRIYTTMAKHDKYKGKELPKIKEFKLIGVNANDLTNLDDIAKSMNDNVYSKVVEYKEYWEESEAKRNRNFPN